MTSTPVRRYRNRLKRFLPQRISSRKALLAEFQCALSLLLREIPTPTYDELVTAFGPPERMAQTLMSSTEAPPLPLPISLARHNNLQYYRNLSNFSVLYWKHGRK